MPKGIGYPGQKKSNSSSSTRGTRGAMAMHGHGKDTEAGEALKSKNTRRGSAATHRHRAKGTRTSRADR